MGGKGEGGGADHALVGVVVAVVGRPAAQRAREQPAQAPPRRSVTNTDTPWSRAACAGADAGGTSGPRQGGREPGGGRGVKKKKREKVSLGQGGRRGAWLWRGCGG